MPRQETFRTRIIIDTAKSSVGNFFRLYDEAMRTRGGGAPTDEEQDLLRAALVFAASGLDSALKELIKATLRLLAGKDAGVQSEIETFVQRQIRGEDEDGDTLAGHKFLAAIISAPSPQNRLLNEYVRFLTGSSLQSVEELFRTVKALGVDQRLVADKKAKLTEAFTIRNIIIHELDVVFVARRGRRYRNARNRPEMDDLCQTIITLAEEIVAKVETKLDAAA